MRNNSTWASWAPSPIFWPPKAWNIPLTLLGLLGAPVAAIIPSIVYVAFAMYGGAISPHHPVHISPDQVITAQLIVYVPLGLYLLAVVPPLSRSSLHELGLRAPTARDIGIGVLGTLVMYLAVSLSGGIIEALTHRHDTELAVSLLQQMKSPGEKILFFVVACVFAPIIEELGFRVFLFNALTRYTSIGLAAVISGILFGALHTDSAWGLLTISVPLAVGGIVLAYVYATTRCYWSNVTTHGLFNAISVVLIFFFHVK